MHFQTRGTPEHTEYTKEIQELSLPSFLVYSVCSVVKNSQLPPVVHAARVPHLPISPAPLLPGSPATLHAEHQTRHFLRKATPT